MKSFFSADTATVHCFFLICVFSTEKRKKLKQQRPEAPNLLLGSNRLQRAYIKKKTYIPWFTCGISRLVPPLGLRVVGCIKPSYPNVYIGLQCLQKHFSIWRSTALDQRLLMDKMSALYHWKRTLRVWRAWRAVVWAKRKQQEVRRAEQELRVDNRQAAKRDLIGFGVCSLLLT